MRQDELWDEFYQSNPRPWRGNSGIPIPCSGDALDLGCGNGKTSSTLVDNGFNVTGVDFSQRAVEMCRDMLPDRTRFEVVDIRDLPFDDCSFDYITAVHVLENLDDPGLVEAVSEIRRVLRPGGYVFCRLFTPDDMRSGSRSKGDFEYTFHTRGRLEELFGGFEVVSSELVEERTRFNTVRSRVECLFHNP